MRKLCHGPKSAFIIMSVVLTSSSAFVIPFPRWAPKRSSWTRRFCSSLLIHGEPIRYVMAPMVAASDYAFRRLVRECNPHTQILGFTQMLHAKNLVTDSSFRRNHFDFCRQPQLLGSQHNCIEGMSIPPSLEYNEGGPLMVQLAGNDVEMVVKAAHIVLEHAPHITGIDLNLGCPQGIARKGRYGAFLMEQEEALVYQILTSLRQSLPKDVLVSAKIRLPLDPTRLKSRITRLAETGIDTLTIHGRTLKENKTLVGPCHVDQVRRAIQVIASTKSLPVVANGGIENYHSISTVLQQTGASAVMSSEALLETPNLFSVAPLETPRELLQQQLNFSRRYVELCAQHPPLPGVLGHDGGSFNIVRGHLFKFLHRYLQIHMDLRDRLADPKLRTLMQASELLEELDERYSSTAALEQCPSSRPESSWYRRHWTESPREEEVDLSVEDRKRRLQERIERLRSLKHQQRLVA